ncbi:MAG: M6 family metalloprotease domain-containing protein [Bacteroidota bacterium]|nr:M6 family metalloprotease domain-containing protein [Bacteroidota bacterium]
MKNKLYTLFSAIVLVACNLICSAQTKPSNCEAAPYPVLVLQADGSTILVQGVGNMMHNHQETTDGFSIIQSANQYYYTNTLGTITAVKAHNPQNRSIEERAFVNTLDKHNDNSLLSLPIVIDHQDELPPVNQSFPETGKRNFLVLLVRYKDEVVTYDQSKFKDLLNKPNYNGTGSFRDYYLAASKGKLDINIDVIDWVVSDSNSSYYANNSTGALPGSQRAFPLVRGAIDQAEKNGINFKKYDNNGDGSVDGILVVHSGYGAEEGSQLQYMWSHRWELGGGYAVNYDGVNISSYTAIPERRNGRMVGIGVICHEFGHLLGLPDLYNVDGTSEGIGNWCLMSGGGWQNSEASPSGLSAWAKTKLNYSTPKVLNNRGLYSLKPASQDSNIYRINTSNLKQYYLLEFRQTKGIDKYLPGKGLAIWKINDSVLFSGEIFNRTNTSKEFPGVMLVQADGKIDLDTVKGKGNRGDAGDLFPGTSFNTEFSDVSKPSAKLVFGQKSYVKLTDIKIVNDSLLTFKVGNDPLAKIFNLNDYKNVCISNSLFIANQSINTEKNIWILPNGKTDTSKTLLYKPSNIGVNKFTLLSIAGTDTSKDVLSINILDKPINNVLFDSTKVGQLKLTLNVNSLVKYYLVNWGDGKIENFSGNTIVGYNYNAIKTYNVSIVGYNGDGCTDTTNLTYHNKQLSVINNASTQSGFSVYPNPTNGVLNIDFNASIGQNYRVVLVSANGKTVYNRNYTVASTALNKISLETSEFEPGIYFLKVLSDNNQFHSKLVMY